MDGAGSPRLVHIPERDVIQQSQPAMVQKDTKTC